MMEASEEIRPGVQSRRCLFCHAHTARNEVLEHLQTGERVAFDLDRGRIWVVCWRCGGWSLVPFESRWEALEECEAAFRKATQRYSSGEIGIAEIPGGLDLIRIGKPLPGEFAAWRYGERFRRRRVKARVRAVLAGAAATGLIVGGGVAAAGGASVVAIGYGYLLASAWFRQDPDRVVARLPRFAESALPLTNRDLRFLRPVREKSELGWALDTQEDERLTGAAATVGLGLVLPLINRWGGSPEDREHALRSLEDAGGPEGYIRAVEKWPLVPFKSLAKPDRLALEMAVNDGVESERLEGELDLLRKAWREAEEVAAIADSLLIPPEIENRVAKWKSRTTRTA